MKPMQNLLEFQPSSYPVQNTVTWDKLSTTDTSVSTPVTPPQPTTNPVSPVAPVMPVVHSPNSFVSYPIPPQLQFVPLQFTQPPFYNQQPLYFQPPSQQFSPLPTPTITPHMMANLANNPNVQITSIPVPDTSNTMPQAASKKGLCKFFARGYCQFGEGCSYIHDTSQQSAQVTKMNMDKTTPCKFFARGYCRFNEKCRYSHESPQYVIPVPNTPTPSDLSQSMIGR